MGKGSVWKPKQGRFSLIFPTLTLFLPVRRQVCWEGLTCPRPVWNPVYGMVGMVVRLASPMSQDGVFAVFNYLYHTRVLAK